MLPSLLELGGYATAFLLGVRLYEPSEQLLRGLLQDPGGARPLTNVEAPWASKLRRAREGLSSRTSPRRSERRLAPTHSARIRNQQAFHFGDPTFHVRQRELYPAHSRSRLEADAEPEEEPDAEPRLRSSEASM